MRKPLVLLTAIILSRSAIAQTGLYIGYENGGLFDRYHYINSKGFSLSQSSIGGVFGGYVGYKVNGYTLETGFYGLYSTHPFIAYNYDSGIPEKSGSMGSGAQSWMIPIRLGKEFVFCNDHFFFRPDISFNTMISRDYSENQPTMGWGANVQAFPGDPNFIATSADSTRAYGYVTSKLNFAIETGLSAGYRFRKKADIYIRGSYVANFKPLYYETITHYSETETVTATSTSVNSFMVQIGVRYYFAKKLK
ncbi:MAG: hypothetical protein AB9834_01155 [Lentimicrobium sp.]